MIPRSCADERERLIAAVARALAEHGYATLTVELVIEMAGVSRGTFHEHFADTQEAVLAAHDTTIEELVGLIMRACNGQPDWPAKVRAAIVSILAFMAAEPDKAHLLTIDAINADLTIARRIFASNDHLAALLGGGREHSVRASLLPSLTEKALVGAGAVIVAGCLLDGEPERLPGLAPQLVELTLIPYLGPEEAARVAAQ